MNKIKIFFGILLFTLFIPSVNALKYDIASSLVNASSNDKNLYEIKVSLKNISDTDYGVGGCSMNISFSDSVKLNGTIRTLGSWSMTVGDVYLFDAGNPALKNTEFMVIPVKVTNNGVVTLSNISCSDGDSDVFIENKVIDLKYTSVNNSQGNNNTQNNNGQNNNSGSNTNTENNNGQNNNSGSNTNTENDNNQGVVLDSNCNLSNIILSDGIIEFDSNVTEYEIDIDNINDLDIDVELESDKASYEIIRNDNSIVIEVRAEDGSKKTYTIYVNNSKEEIDNKNSQIYVPIFIGIICILVLINIIRIVRNMKNKG